MLNISEHEECDNVHDMFLDEQLVLFGNPGSTMTDFF
jgi:hypothetical protein